MTGNLSVFSLRSRVFLSFAQNLISYLIFIEFRSLTVFFLYEPLHNICLHRGYVFLSIYEYHHWMKISFFECLEPLDQILRTLVTHG